MQQATKSEQAWLCVSCGRPLGTIKGGEFYPDAVCKDVHTSGPNLVVTCPDCGFVKTWYTADHIVRAVYQLVNAISEQAATSMVRAVGAATRDLRKPANE